MNRQGPLVERVMSICLYHHKLLLLSAMDFVGISTDFWKLAQIFILFGLSS